MFFVSIWITTFNHEKFVAKAIDSVLMQKTNFRYEIIIGEDCSQDRTREIVISYKQKYPDRIQLFLPEKNLGCNPMFYATYPLCKGKYVAWLDGDDFWTDPYKLQKQVDFMEKSPDIVFCFHKVKLVDDENKFIQESANPFRNEDDTLEIKHFLDEFNPIDTPSFLYRNILGDQLPAWFYKISLADLGFYFMLLQYGKGKFLKDTMAAYRKHGGGAWSGASYYHQNEQLARFYEILQPEIPSQYKEKIDSFRCYHYYILFELELLRGNYKRAIPYYKLLKNERFKDLSKRKMWVAKLVVKFMLKPFRKYK